jgi:hypothetical protein
LEDRGSEAAFKKTFVGELEVMQEDDELFQDFEPEDFAEGQFFDELSGEELDPKKSVEARLEELTFMKNISLYDEKDVEECWRVTGKAPISTKWVGKKKGAEVRMRLVARDFKPRGERMRGDLFAATPPLEARGGQAPDHLQSQETEDEASIHRHLQGAPEWGVGSR